MPPRHSHSTHLPHHSLQVSALLPALAAQPWQASQAPLLVGPCISLAALNLANAVLSLGMGATAAAEAAAIGEELAAACQPLASSAQIAAMAAAALGANGLPPHAAGGAGNADAHLMTGACPPPVAVATAAAAEAGPAPVLAALLGVAPVRERQLSLAGMQWYVSALALRCAGSGSGGGAGAGATATWGGGAWGEAPALQLPLDRLLMLAVQSAGALRLLVLHAVALHLLLLPPCVQPEAAEAGWQGKWQQRGHQAGQQQDAGAGVWHDRRAPAQEAPDTARVRDQQQVRHQNQQQQRSADTAALVLVSQVQNAAAQGGNALVREAALLCLASIPLTQTSSSSAEQGAGMELARAAEQLLSSSTWSHSLVSQCIAAVCRQVLGSAAAAGQSASRAAAGCSSAGQGCCSVVGTLLLWRLLRVQPGPLEWLLQLLRTALEEQHLLAALCHALGQGQEGQGCSWGEGGGSKSGRCAAAAAAAALLALAQAGLLAPHAERLGQLLAQLQGREEAREEATGAAFGGVCIPGEVAAWARAVPSLEWVDGVVLCPLQPAVLLQLATQGQQLGGEITLAAAMGGAGGAWSGGGDGGGGAHTWLQVLAPLAAAPLAAAPLWAAMSSLQRS